MAEASRPSIFYIVLPLHFMCIIHKLRYSVSADGITDVYQGNRAVNVHCLNELVEGKSDILQCVTYPVLFTCTPIRQRILQTLSARIVLAIINKYILSVLEIKGAKCIL